MAKGPIVTPGIEALIASVYDKHPKWKAPRVRMEVEFLLIKRGRRFPEGWPSLSAVQKVLAVVRKNLKKDSLEDKPWSIGTMTDASLVPPEALPTVLRVWVHNRLKWGTHLTIRQAKWAARLYAFASSLGVDWLLFCANTYALIERMHEVTDTTLSSAHALDLFLLFAMTAKDDEVTPEVVRKVLEPDDMAIYLNLINMGARRSRGEEAPEEGYEVAIFRPAARMKKRGGTK